MLMEKPSIPHNEKKTGETPAIDPLAGLIIRVADGDNQAFQELVTNTESRIRTYLRRSGLTPEEHLDCLQDTYLAVFRHAKRYDPWRPPMPWLLAIAINTARGYFRARRRSDWLRSVIPASFHNVTSPETTTSVRDELAFLEEQARQLPEKQRQVLALSATSALTLSEIAELLKIPEGTVKTNLYRARATLAHALLTREKGGTI
jgi:RNA polymerase sigma-70 factor (ECF subfamily)